MTNPNTLRPIECYICKREIWMTDAEKSSLKQSNATWHCMWGHSQVFVRGDTEADVLRRERDRLKQENARLEDYRKASELAEQAALEHARYQERRAAAARGQVTKLKKRAAAGVCPCCNRQFVDLMRHMAGKHPGFMAEEIASGASIQ